MLLGSYSSRASCFAASNSFVAFGSFYCSQIVQTPAWSLTNLFSAGKISGPLVVCEIFPLIVAFECVPPVIPKSCLGSVHRCDAELFLCPGKGRENRDMCGYGYSVGHCSGTPSDLLLSRFSGRKEIMCQTPSSSGISLRVFPCTHSITALMSHKYCLYLPYYLQGNLCFFAHPGRLQAFCSRQNLKNCNEELLLFS